MRKARKQAKHGMQLGESGYGIVHGVVSPKHGIGIQHFFGKDEKYYENNHEKKEKK